MGQAYISKEKNISFENGSYLLELMVHAQLGEERNGASEKEVGTYLQLNNEP